MKRRWNQECRRSQKSWPEFARNVTAMGSSPISFSINQALDAVTRVSLVSAARKAERKGFSTFTVADHFNTPMAPFTALTVVATSTLRVAPYVLRQRLPPPQRSQLGRVTAELAPVIEALG